jgi:hypothetical protein
MIRCISLATRRLPSLRSSVRSPSSPFCGPGASVCSAAGGATIVKAVTNYFGKESASEATEWVTKKGGQELTERLAAKATKEGGEATVDQVATLASKYGPDAVRGLDNAPSIRPVLSAMGELPENQSGLRSHGLGQVNKAKCSPRP